MLPALALTAACAAWEPAVAGYYEGVVESRGEKRIETWLSVTPEGRLQGHYVLHEAERVVRGTLEPVAAAVPCETAVFQWTDVYGTGVAQLRFFPERHCFEGAWGMGAVRDDLAWRSCTRERVTS